MKILNLCMRDYAGAAWSLSHALNKVYPEHRSINLAGLSNIYNYPRMAEMRDYDLSTCRQLTYGSDVVVFHSVLKPYFDGLALNPRKLKKTKKLLYFHGSEMRNNGDALIKQAHELLGDFEILVSTPDLTFFTDEPVHYMPVCRSFTEIRRKYTMCNQDKRALHAFWRGASQLKDAQSKVIFSHAPSDEYKKGSPTFYRVITDVMKQLPQVNFQNIKNQPWDSCLRFLSHSDVYFDSDAPFLYCYGAVSVEASTFKIPVVTRLSQEVIDRMEKLTGLNSPFVTFVDENDLFVKAYRLGSEPKLRRRFGELAYKYCRAIHDEKPVAQKFMNVIEEMD